MMRKIWMAVASALIAAHVTADLPPPPMPGPEDAPILLPVMVAGLGGRYDTRWSSELHIFNASDSESVSVLPVFFRTAVAPRDTAGADAFVQNLVGGAFTPQVIWVRRQLLDYVHVGLWLKEDTGRFPKATSHIPTVKENELRTAPAEFVGIRATAGRRMTLRIFDIDSHGETEYRLRIYDVGGRPDTLLSDQLIAVHRRGSSPYIPGYAVVDLDVPTHITARIEVAPVVPSNSRFWAMISYTDNVTQELTVVPPQ